LSATIDPSIFGAGIRKRNVGYDMAQQAVNGAVGGVAGALAARALQKFFGRPAASIPVRGSADSRFDAPTR
jgi:energy-converting hydrogenase Eha subunit A